MSETRGNPELVVLLGGQPDADPLPEGRRLWSNIYCNIEYLSLHTPHELPLFVRRYLVVQTSNRPLSRMRPVHLDEPRDAEICVLLRVVHLHEESAIVGETRRLQEKHSLQPNFLYLHITSPHQGRSYPYPGSSESANSCFEYSKVVFPFEKIKTCTFEPRRCTIRSGRTMIYRSHLNYSYRQSCEICLHREINIVTVPTKSFIPTNFPEHCCTGSHKKAVYNHNTSGTSPSAPLKCVSTNSLH